MPDNLVIFMPQVRVAARNHTRYAFVRNPQAERRAARYADNPNLCHALYDIVDNREGAERVLAYGVRHEPALAIVGALNAQEEAERIAKLPPPAA